MKNSFAFSALSCSGLMMAPLLVAAQTVAPAPTPSPPPTPSSWSRIATEWFKPFFTIEGTRKVRFGRNNSWVEKTMTGRGLCSARFFDADPAVGQLKFCEVFNPAIYPVDPPPVPSPTIQPPIVKAPGPGYSGKLMNDPNSVHHFVYDRDNNNDGLRDPAYLAGSGGPEGFLYESRERKDFIINKILSSTRLKTPVNGLYFHALRAFGGDGEAHETPFINNSDPYSGIDFNKLASWSTDLKKLDDAGVIIWFNLFDDHAIPFGCKFNIDYERYATTIVNYFKDLKHIVWVTQEEYRFTDGAQRECTIADNDERQSGLAAAIGKADPVHPIATHHMNGEPMVFLDDQYIRVFGQQTGEKSPEAMHTQAGKQGWGNWVYVMAEAHPWHKNLIDAENSNANGRELMRKSHWASAMAGGYVMMYNSFECGIGTCKEGAVLDSEPTDLMLDDLRRLKLFMELIPHNKMRPLFDTELSNVKIEGTKYILADPQAGLYTLYGDYNTARMGVRNAPAGDYALTWFSPVSGVIVNLKGTVAPGALAVFNKPTTVGPEAVLFMRKK